MTADSTVIDYIICGAAKSGTTYVSEVLKKSRQVDFCIRKEPNYFCHKENSGNFYKGVDWYRNLFANNGLPKCEASTRYMYTDESPELIYAVKRKARLIFLLRNPVERTYSDFWESVKRGKQNTDIMTALKAEESETLLNGSRYAKHLKRYYRIFPSQQIFVLIYEEMIEDQQRFLERLFVFLGLDVNEHRRQTIAAVKSANTSALPRWPVLSRIYHDYTLRHYLEFLPYPLNRYLLGLGARAKPLVLRNKRYPPMTVEVRQFLFDRLIDDMKETEKLLGRDLSRWTKKRP